MSGTIINNGSAYSAKINQSSHPANISSLASNITTSVDVIQTDTSLIGRGAPSPEKTAHVGDDMDKVMVKIKSEDSRG
ncbi:hypothetical protein QDW80_003832 [Salmonella enterica]|nr:hypothetical protein [Salmonella enterica]